MKWIFQPVENIPQPTMPAMVIPQIQSYPGVVVPSMGKVITLNFCDISTWLKSHMHNCARLNGKENYSMSMFYGLKMWLSQICEIFFWPNKIHFLFISLMLDIGTKCVTCISELIVGDWKFLWFYYWDRVTKGISLYLAESFVSLPELQMTLIAYWEHVCQLHILV